MHISVTCQRRTGGQTVTAISTDFESGGQIAGCTLLERIGLGGESVVWSATHSALSHPVVIRLTPIHTGNLHEAEGLLRQAQILSRLAHSHVLPLYDTGISSGNFYTVSRYCANGSLDQMMRKRKLSTVEVLLFAMQIALALNHLHNHRVVHRDVKPANIVLDINQHAYLTDFGVSEQLVGRDTPQHGSYGTAPYVPPEHRLGEDVTQASDIYSFGIMLFEMLEGSLPWDGRRALHQFQIRDPKATLPPLGSGYPPAVHHVLRAMTQAYPEDRTTSALQCYQDLHEAFGSPDIRSTGVMPSAKDVALTLVLRGRQSWITHPQQFPLRLTDLAYIDSQINVIDQTVYPDLGSFMLHGALTYDYQVDYWWQRMQRTYRRMDLCERILYHEKNPSAALTKLLTFETEYLCEQLAPETWDRLAELANGKGPGYQLAGQLLAQLDV